ncbi:hypothetical protein JKP88DRAFT_330925 [Tribonema minus]|uniref:Uncharacterized protein n=1 Tax=Tribonema minus TaxID=303371 RepID=A0A835YM35_9STRA|nr:hypothetical protein JKP88DRAFT_330925 [Tribonema minus]
MEVGAAVRVLRDGQWRRGTIAFVNPDGSYDILVTADLTEVNGVGQDAIEALFAFETDLSLPTDDTTSSTADLTTLVERLQGFGKQLFLLPDYEAAGDVYELALQHLTPPLTIGSEVLVPLDDGRVCRAGMISAMSSETGTVDVIFDEEDEHGVDEEEAVAASRVLRLSLLPLQHVTMLVNSAKCAAKAGSTQDARERVVSLSTRALVLGKHYLATAPAGEARRRLHALCLNALHLRARAHLAAARVKPALRDAQAMRKAAAGGADDAAARAAERLVSEIKRAERALLRGDRRLAREVGAWVEASLKRHDEAVNGEGEGEEEGDREREGEGEGEGEAGGEGNVGGGGDGGEEGEGGGGDQGAEESKGDGAERDSGEAEQGGGGRCTPS